MNRKIYLLLTVFLAMAFNLKAQTAQIESITANPGDAVSFDIDVAGLPADVAAVSLFIGYDANVLTFTGSTGGELGTGYILNNMVGSSQIGIQWTDYLGGDDINGTLLTLNFQYNAIGGSCELTFDPGCEFTDINLNPVTVAYTNGAIGPNAGVATITIDEIVANAGPVSLGVTGAGFTGNVGAMTLFIKFDPTILQFSGYTSTVPFILISGNNTQGMVSVAYSSSSGAPINNTFLTLNFNYNGTGSSDLVFQNGCEITYTNLTPEVVSFDNGKVEPLSTAYQLSLENELATPGSMVGIDVTGAGFPNNVAAITLYIGYNPAHMEFLGLSSGVVNGAYANVVNQGLIGITWTNFMTGQAINGTLFTLNFDYNFGSSDITFEGGSELVDLTLTAIPTTFNDGSIAPITGGPEVSMPVKTGTVGQPIDFPVRAENFSMDIAAISLFIGFDNGVLTYTGNTTGTISNYFINLMGNGQLGLQWTSFPNGVDIDPNGDDTLFTLHFNYNGGVCDVTFNGGCEFAQIDLNTAPVSFFDGGVITGSRFDITAFLEGPFNGTTMNTSVNSGGYLPLAQPFNVSPWNYMGTENVTVIPNGNVVDWVLVEIRETAGGPAAALAGTVVARQAGFILNDGSIVEVDGTSEILVPTTFDDDIYVVIYHRNHVPMMSATAVPVVSDVYTYDFTTSQAQAYLSGQKQLTGAAAMFAADGDGNGFVNNFDLFFVWMAQVGQQGYYGGDFDLNTFVQNFDLFFMWMANVGSGTQVP